MPFSIYSRTSPLTSFAERVALSSCPVTLCNGSLTAFVSISASNFQHHSWQDLRFMCYVLTRFDHFIFFLQLVSCLLNWVVSSCLFSLSICFFPSFSHVEFLSFFSFSSTVCDACPSLPLFISIHNCAFTLVLLGKLVYLPPRNLDILMRRWPCFLRQWLEESLTLWEKHSFYLVF